jgi:hypothetical protein
MTRLLKSTYVESDKTGRRLDLMSIVELDVLLAYPPVEGDPRVCKPGFCIVLLARPYEDGVDAAEERQAGRGCHNGDHEPVLRHPEDELDVIVVPAVSEMVGEEAPRVIVVLVGEEDANTVGSFGAAVVVVSPDDAQEERAGGGHDGDVWQHPFAVVVGEGVNGLEEERVAGDRAHSIVGDARGRRATNPGWVGEEWVEAAIASLPATLVTQNESSMTSHVHRRDLCRCHRSGGAQSILSRRRA